MSQSRPVVVHRHEGMPELSPEIEGRQFFDGHGRWIGWSGWIRNDAGDVSGWHHHASNETYVYVIRGSLTIEYGPGGDESVEARAGDFFVVPSETIHRETTGADADLEGFIIRVGAEPERVDVDGPDET